MRKFLLIIAILSLLPSAYAERTIVTQSPYYMNHYMNSGAYGHNRYYGNFPEYNHISELNALEKYAFNRNYRNDNNLNRLQRLEMAAFGTIQQGDFDKRYNNVRSAILSRPKTYNNTSVWKNIGNYFAGQMTGFTPPITSNDYLYMPPDYGKSTYTDYSNPWSKSFRTNNYGMSSRSGITVLD